MKHTFVTGVIAVLALVAAACGSDSVADESTATTAPPPPTTSSTDFVDGLNEVCADLDDTLFQALEDQDDSIDAIVDGRELEELSPAELADVAAVLDEGAEEVERISDQFADDAAAVGLPDDARRAVDDAVEALDILVELFPEIADAFAVGDGDLARDLAEEAEGSGEDDLVEVAANFDDLGVEACGSESESFGESEDDDAADPEAFVEDLDAICAEAQSAGELDEAALTDAFIGLQAASENGFAAGDPDYDRALAEAVFALETASGHAEEALAQIEALDVPADAETALSELVAFQEDGLALVAELSAAFAADDGAAISALLDESEADEASRDAQQQALADELGAAECAPDEE